MKVGLFIPCYVDLFYPKVGIATLEVLEKLGVDVVFPTSQTCCGQPMANTGFGSMTHGVCEVFTDNFKDCDYVVSPSGSCSLHIKNHLESEKNHKGAEKIKHNIFEFSEFLIDVLKIDKIDAYFPHKIGLINSCHGLRGLNLSNPSELVIKPFSKPKYLLNQVKGIEITEAKRVDECCGFGGTFCVAEAAVSASMGSDLVDSHLVNGVEYLVGGDMSCLMHLEGILKRRESKVQVLHISQVLNSN
jgi:L-lactate dehydrogenase complex protein LldE